MNLMLAIIQFILIGITILFEYRRGSISVFLWAMLLIMVGFAHLSNIISGSEKYPEQVYIQASIFGILFIIIYLIMRNIDIFSEKVNVMKNIRSKIHNNELELEMSQNFILQWMKVILFGSVLGMMKFAIVTFGSLGQSSWAGLLYSGVSVYSVKSIWGIIYLISGMGILLPCAILFFCLYQKKYISLIVYSFIMLIPTIITRNRASMLPIFVTFILFLYVKYERITVMLCIKYIVLASFVLLALYIFRAFRSYGTISAFINSFNWHQFITLIFNMFRNNDGELGLINAFYYFIDGKGDFPEFNTLATYKRIFLMMIPTRFSLGLKPNDFAIAMGSAYINDYTNTRYSMHPTLLGDCFANMNWFGIFLGGFWAFFIEVVDRICNRISVICSIFLVTIWGYTYLLVGRGSVYNGVCTGVRLTLMLACVYWVAVKFKIRRKKKWQFGTAGE